MICRIVRIIPFCFVTAAGFPVHAETNLEVAWKACVNSATSLASGSDFEHLDYINTYVWNEIISSGCKQVQEEVASRAKVKAEAERAEREQAWKKQNAEQATRVLPLINRALSDPDGITIKMR